MTRVWRPIFSAGALLALSALTALPAVAATLEVVALEPAAHAAGASVDTPIVIAFDRPVDPRSIDSDSFWGFGRWSGTITGSYAFSDAFRTVALTPDRPLAAGESVMIILSRDIIAQDGSPLRDAGYAYQFWTRAQPATPGFSEIDRLTTRTLPAESSRAYGGVATDLDGDGFPDITIVNEDTADLRVFMNRADASGLVYPFGQPTFPVGPRASPSEPSDFDRNGHADICVANINDNSVSILLGNGDGTFGTQQKISVGPTPRGIAVLDVDGDGDVDIVNTNAGAGALNMSLLLNDGSGVFGAPTFFAAGGPGAWALGAADMDDDGILDLVIGARDAQRIFIHRGQGDGTFAPAGFQVSGGPVWMLVLGDVDGDGCEDVATVNSAGNDGAMLFGDGQGGLALPQSYATDPFPLATDLGDVDGDGDLDWMASSFGGDWWLYLNDGAGGFAFSQELAAPRAASCSLMVDLDVDGDLDLALIDELEDEVILMRNGGFAPSLPPPGVPDGASGSVPLTVGKLAGGALSISWDVSTCADGVDHHLLFGAGSQLPALASGTYGLGGARCGAGTRPPLAWLEAPDPSSDPTGLIWFVVVAGNGRGTEGSWGTDGNGNERSGPGVNGSSGMCGVTDKDASNACGQ